MIFLILSLSINLSGDVYTFKEYIIRGNKYVKSSSLLEELKFSYFEDPNTQILSIQREKVVYIMPDNPFVKVNEEIYQLEAPPIREGKELFIPISSLSFILGSLTDMEVKFTGEVLEVGSKANIYKTKWDVSSSETVYTIECSSNLKTLFNRVGEEWVLVIFDPIYNKNVFDLTPNGLIKEIKLEEGSGFVKIRLKTERNVTIDSIREGSLLKLRAKTFVERRIRTIVIDPGHGGEDPGATYKDIKEKDIVLKVGKELYEKLKNKGFNVIMTRTEDVFLPLKTRTRFADSVRADLFVSIHCNAAPYKREMEGAETYFLSAARSDWARTVEATENSAIRFEVKEGGGISELDYILNDLAQTQFLEESQQAAICIQESMVHKTGLYNRGVKQANFYVLRLNFMPAVLVEIAFITNSSDRGRLLNENFIKGISEAIAEGIEAYAKSRT
ncbi:MAG: N-acetylmuramoyl-L-alanine amidase [candidate division WOR-3 bacterium]